MSVEKTDFKYEFYKTMVIELVNYVLLLEYIKNLLKYIY